MDDSRIYGLTQQRLIFYSCHNLIGSTGNSASGTWGSSIKDSHPLREPWTSPLDFFFFFASNWQVIEGRTKEDGLRGARNPSTAVHIPLAKTQPHEPT